VPVHSTFLVASENCWTSVPDFTLYDRLRKGGGEVGVQERVGFALRADRSWNTESRRQNTGVRMLREKY